MTLDAASTPCCCGAATGICCYPIATATMQITIVEKYKHFFDGQILDQSMSSHSTTVTFTRQLPGTGQPILAVCTNTAAYTIRTNTTQVEPHMVGTSCPGETDYYFCLPCKPPYPPCQTIEYRMPEGNQAICQVGCGSCRNEFSEPVGSTYDRPMTTIRISFPFIRYATTTGSGLPGDQCYGSGSSEQPIYVEGEGITCGFYDQCFTLEALRDMHFAVQEGSILSVFKDFTNQLRCPGSGYPYRPEFAMCGNSIYSTGGLLYSNMGACPAFLQQGFCTYVRDTPSNQLLPLKNIYLSTCPTPDCGQPYQCYYVDCFGQLISTTQSCGCDSILGYDDGVNQAYYTDGWGTSAQGVRQHTYEREIFVTVT